MACDETRPACRNCLTYKKGEGICDYLTSGAQPGKKAGSPNAPSFKALAPAPRTAAKQKKKQGQNRNQNQNQNQNDIEIEIENEDRDAESDADQDLVSRSSQPPADADTGLALQLAELQRSPQIALSDRAAPFLWTEGRSLSYFQHHSTKELPGYFDSEFWRVTVLAIGNSEPCVHQTLVAVGALHEAAYYDASPNPPPYVANQRIRALEEHCKAIRMFNKHLAEQCYTNLKVTLTCLVLLISYEYLQRSIRAANTHLKFALAVVSEWLENKNRVPNRTRIESPDGYYIQNQVKPMLVTLALHSRTALDPPRIPLPIISEEDRHFEALADLNHARDTLAFLLTYVFPEVLTYRDQASADTTRQWPVYLGLQKWRKCFDDLVSRNPSLAAEPRAAVLDMWHQTAEILFQVENGNSELSYDLYNDRFGELVERVERLFRESPIPRWRFSVDMGAVPVLYYVAMKCRHRRIRRRAIKLLQESPRCEAAFDSQTCAGFASEHLAIEEAGLDDIDVADEAVIPEHARVLGRVPIQRPTVEQLMTTEAGPGGPGGWVAV